MAKFHVDWVDNKSADWKIATLTNEMGNTEKDVSINRTNKKGEVFPNFDGITPGADILGEAWRSPAGKMYLFAPDVKTYSGNGQKPQGGAYRGSQGVAKAQERKAEYVEKAQDNKELGIRVSSTIRMAVEIVLAEGGTATMTQEDTQDRIKMWRSWLWSEWSKEDKDFPPFN